MVARSTSLNFKSRIQRPTSASISIPNSPDQDLEAFLESQFGNLEAPRTSPNRFSQSATGMGNVPVIGYGGRLPPKKVCNFNFLSAFRTANCGSQGERDGLENLGAITIVY